ncbi:hypothetical protein GCM10023311_11940 [Flaviramulus aquimarinus]|uniref:Uncharacterized protein n=1 Tax=Flaviramulus aquimarinus TaxID=1170456 RepID=A0ABP9F6P3_9FLAO
MPIAPPTEITADKINRYRVFLGKLIRNLKRTKTTIKEIIEYGTTQVKYKNPLALSKFRDV